MKRPDNTEMENLLRRFAGRQGETLPAAGGAGEASKHLDADELSAYAEDALPESARSRYFAHLADCDTCRKLVTELTLQAVAADEAKTRLVAAAAPPRKSWREWFGAIFSPPVLRYGVPALALLAIIAVAVIVRRTGREESFVAQNKEAARTSVPAVTANSNSAAPSGATLPPAKEGDVAKESESSGNVAPATDSPDASESSPPLVASATPPPRTDTRTQSAEPSPKPAEGEPLVAQSQGERGKVDVFGNTAAKTAQQEPPRAAVAQPPGNSPAPSAPVSTEEAGRDKELDEQKKTKAPAKDDDEKISVAGSGVGGRALGKAEATEVRRPEREASATATATQAAPRRRATGAAKSGPSEAVEDSDRVTETRSVGGRRFYRQGGAWVDAAYNSSQRTTGVQRGSEHYRALVADEPGLRNIVEHLGGQLIVIWKGRAYRFY